MQELSIGGILFQSDGNTLTISARDGPSVSFRLERDGVEELIDFVGTLAGTKLNRRNAFRVPIWESSELAVTIRKESTELTVAPINLSLTGMAVGVPTDANIELSLDDEVEVTLVFEGDTSTYQALVRRMDDKSCGLFFPESMKGEELDPPNSLVRVVMELQRQWLAKRAKRAT